MNLLADKTAVVTGSAGNLGRIWCEVLMEAGATVFGVDLPAFDVSVDELDVGRVDILINNAAIDNPPGSGATFFGNFRKILDVNLTGAVRMTEQVIPGMIKAGGGVIVNIGSIQGYGAADIHNYDPPFQKPFGYNASKWGLRGLSKAITGQYGHYGIRGVTISFGCVDTPKIKPEFASRYLARVPLGRMISRKSLEMTMLYACCCPDLAGADWRVDGGLGVWA
jgi:3alpha(or 20beta)-hydroxysteroid dehydrogenase